MAKKKYKFKLWNIECTITDLEDLMPLTNTFRRAAEYERDKGHLKKHADYYELREDIAKQIKEQIQ